MPTRIFYLILLFSISACRPSTKQKADARPNVVIIFTDDQGYNDVGCFGSPDINTPNIDQLAMEGVRYTSFYVAQPVCSASRAALLTGCYPNRLGLNGALMPQSTNGIHPDETTMAEMLQEEGYITGVFGKWHLGNGEKYNPLNHGFDEYFGIPYSNDMWPNHPWQGSVFDFPPLPLYDGFEIVDELDDQSQLTTDLTERAVSFINKNRDQPFFLYVPHPQPHVPLYVSEKFKGKSKRGLYGDVIMEIDWSVGQIVNALADNDLTDNTLVIFTSDNGPWLSYGPHSGSAYPLREGKGTNWEGGMREPCVMRYPNVLPSGVSVDVPFMSIDLLPTIANLVGAAKPKNVIDGKDVLSILQGKSAENPHKAYAYYYFNNELQAIRSGDYKLMLPQRYRSLNGATASADSLPIAYQQNMIEEPELYNIKLDPSESTNIIDGFPAIVDSLMLYADQFRSDLGDNKIDMPGTGRRAYLFED